MNKRISYSQTPQATALEYDEQRDLEAHPEKAGYYEKLIKERTMLGRDFETKGKPKKGKR